MNDWLNSHWFLSMTANFGDIKTFVEELGWGHFLSFLLERERERERERK